MKSKNKTKGKEEEVKDDYDGEGEVLQEVNVGAIITAKDFRPKRPKEEPALPKKSRKDYITELSSLIETNDVLLLVLDARVPSECRMKEHEARWLKASKKIVIVLTKSDLIPEAVLEAWYQAMSKELPTAIFSTISDPAAQVAELCKKIEGACANAEQIKVGIVGYPNVGKRSLHKAISQKSPVNSKIVLDDQIGTILAKKEPNALIIKYVGELNDLSDPYVPVHALIKKVSKDELLLQYEIQDYSNTQEFLACIARKQGLLLKGGLPDYDAAARLVLKDWIEGRIRFYEECC